MFLILFSLEVLLLPNLKSIESHLFISAILLSCSTALFAQPKSPRMKVEAEISGVNIKVDFGAPSVNERTIWGELVPFNKVWRTGANEATTLEVDQAILIEGNELPAGKYAMFTIPSEENWTVIFNSDFNQLGAYKYDETKNVVMFEVPIQNAEHQEQMQILVEENQLDIHWEKALVSMKITGKG